MLIGREDARWFSGFLVFCGNLNYICGDHVWNRISRPQVLERRMWKNMEHQTDPTTKMKRNSKAGRVLCAQALSRWQMLVCILNAKEPRKGMDSFAGCLQGQGQTPLIFLVLLYKAKEFNPPLMGNKVTFHFTTFHWKSQHAINLLPRIKRIPGTPRVSY